MRYSGTPDSISTQTIFSSGVGRVQPSEELITLNVLRSLRTHNGLKFNTIHEIFSMILRGAGIVSNAETHVCRKVAVLLAESRGLSESQIRSMGKWGTRSDALTGTYMPTVSAFSAVSMAGYSTAKRREGDARPYK